QGKLGQNYRKTMLCPQKDNQIPFPSGTSGKIDVFFNSLLVRVVWCEFKSESGHWKKAHLLLSTDAKLTPEQIIEAYGE
ncbi:hypothetical protein, partial [Thiolapillus sp.]|uniref:hypothetical protein n=1 Tax=Thiolapillus sp. TaxID=2017437 RepID=UPI003AF8C441